MSLTSSPRVFLSYARRDGEAFATALRQRLAQEQPEITLWQDRAEMEGGINWWAQIEAALDQVQYLVVILTPLAIASEITQREWRSARQRGVNVYPVKGVADAELNYEALPNWMRKAHFFDVGQWTGGSWQNVKEWDTFVNYLKSDRQPRRVPFLAPDLPHEFVPRSREFDALVQSVLAPDQREPTTITTALQGSGGYGKTTLAIALCHDQGVEETFDDGVLWTSLGQTPRILDELLKWYEALTGRARAFVDKAQASTQLAEALEHRKCLLVIDDVWERDHLEPFLRGGPECARVVTTRRTDLLRGAPRIRVDEMTPRESRHVLQLAVPAGFAEGRVDDVARRLGEWPLLLQLAAGMIRKRLDRGDSVDGALTHVERALDKRGVVAFDAKDARRREDAVSSTVSASREQLDADDDRRFLRLVIFPEEVSIPLSTLQRLWQLDEVDAAECAQRLDDVALLSLDLRRGLVSLHDVMRTYLERQQQGDVAEIHANLVASYEDVLHLPDEYAWRWLPHHLAEARQTDRLRTLLLRPDWLGVVVRVVGPFALLDAFDLMRGDPTLDRIQRALRLALPALVADPAQLCEQLLGRLRETESRELQTFRERLLETAPTPRLHAEFPNLVGPGALTQTMDHRDSVRGAMVLPDGRILSWSDDQTLRIWHLGTGEGHTLAGHTGSIRGALLLPDASVLSWSDDGTLRIWDSTSCDGHVVGVSDAPIRGALLLPDGCVLSWSDNHTLQVWNIPTGEVRTVGRHERRIRGALALPNSQVLSWSDDRTLRVWNLVTATSRILDGHEGLVIGALLLADQRVLSWSDDRDVRVWDLSTGDERCLRVSAEPIAGALPVSDGQLLLWGVDADPTLRLWNPANGESRMIGVHDGHIRGAVMLREGLALSWSDHALRSWDLRTGTEGAHIEHENWVRGAVGLTEGRLLTWSRDRTLRVWDLATVGSGILTGHERSVVGALQLADGDVLSWSSDGSLGVWQPSTGQGRKLNAHRGWVEGALVLPDRRLLSWGADGTLRMWNVSTGDGKTLTDLKGWVKGALVLPDGRVLWWTLHGTLGLWDVATGQGRVLNHSHDGSGDPPLILPDGQVLSWSRRDGVQVWSPATDETRTLTGNDGLALGALLLPNERVLTWNADHTLRVWTIDTGGRRTLAGHQGDINGALCLPDGRLLSWSRDHTLRVWTLAGEEQILKGHQNSVLGALVLSEGRVVSWSEDNTLRLWNLATGESRSLAGHQNSVIDALLLERGRLLSWSLDRSLRHWDVTRNDAGRPFYLDGTPTVVLSIGADRFFVGDSLGRVHFLRRIGVD